MFDPVFKITPSILSSVSQVEAARAVIENAPLLPLYERQFKTDATVRKVHFSTAIEGNYLKIDEVKKIVDSPESSRVFQKAAEVHVYKDAHGETLFARQRDIHEVINYRDVIRYIESISSKNVASNTKFKLSEKIIKEIHKILLRNIADDIAGKYRIGTALTVNYATGEKLYPYENVGNFKGKLRELIEWFNDNKTENLNPILKAGILHLEFVRIHPFEEGNGRLARALATLVLSEDGYDVGHFFCLDEYYDSNAQDYYHYLDKGFKDLTAWLEYFALGMAIEFSRIKERVLKLSKDAKVKEKAGQVFITERQEKILEWINDYGYLRNRDFDRLFPTISDDTVLRELKGLKEAGIIVKKGKTKSARYELN